MLCECGKVAQFTFMSNGYIYNEVAIQEVAHFFVASINMARVQCSTSSVCDGGGGKGGCSIRSQPSIKFSFLPTSDTSVA